MTAFDRRIGPVVACWLLALAAGCASSRPGARPPRTVKGGLIIVCDPADAEVLLNDRFVGVASTFATRPLPLAEGQHRVELRRDGYFSAHFEVRGARGVRQQLDVELRQIPF